jgi:hypothetical protein
MAWTTNSPNSRVFVAWIDQVMQVSGTGYTGIDSDTINGALFNNTTTPDATVAVASTGFNTGVWVTANEVTDVTNWVSGGRALASKTFTFPGAAAIWMFDAADLAGGGNVTITSAWGILHYDNTITAGTVAKQGICYNYFGGAQSVTAGTFTVIYNVAGIMRGTV